MTIRIQTRPMVDRPVGTFCLWIVHPDHRDAPFLVGFMRNDGDGRWTARPRCSRKGASVPAPWRRLADRSTATA